MKPRKRMPVPPTRVAADATAVARKGGAPPSAAAQRKTKADLGLVDATHERNEDDREAEEPQASPWDLAEQRNSINSRGTGDSGGDISLGPPAPTPPPPAVDPIDSLIHATMNDWRAGDKTATRRFQDGTADLATQSRAHPEGSTMDDGDAEVGGRPVPSMAPRKERRPTPGTRQRPENFPDPDSGVDHEVNAFEDQIARRSAKVRNPSNTTMSQGKTKGSTP